MFMVAPREKESGIARGQEHCSFAKNGTRHAVKVRLPQQTPALFRKLMQQPNYF